VRKPAVFLAVVAAVLALAGPAFAHEEISPKQFPTGQPTFFTLSAANEKDVDLNKITITAPQNLKFGDATRIPAGWTVDHSDTAITWTGGPLKPNQFEQWGYEIEGADQPGTVTYKVTLGYADGKSDDVQVQTTAVAAGGGAATTVAPSSGAGAMTATTEAAKANGGSAARTRANIALVIGIVALVLGVVALALAARKRGAGGPAAPAATGGGQRQDW